MNKIILISLGIIAGLNVWAYLYAVNNSSGNIPTPPLLNTFPIIYFPAYYFGTGGQGV